MKQIRTKVFGVSQTEFAAIAGVNQSTVCRWEAGGLDPRRADMESIMVYAREHSHPFSAEWFFE